MPAELKPGDVESGLFNESVSVPKNDVARLMYYFSCICGLVDYEGSCPNIERYCDYHSYHTMTKDDISIMLGLCHSFFGPGSFEHAKIFIYDGKLCGPGHENWFYDVAETQTVPGITVFPTAIIHGKNVRVKRIMAYKFRWLERNYNYPYLKLSKKHRVQLIDPPSTGGSSCELL